MSQAITEAMKPCPFCGGQPHLMHCGAGTYMIQCLQCKATTDDGSQERITANWNRRSALSAAQAAIKPLNWQHDGNASYAYCPVTDVRWAARNPAERAHAEATREARIRSALVPPAVPWEVEKPTACVGEMKTSAGSDYYVCVRVGDRELTPHMHKIRSRAEYEVAEWRWLFNGGEKPDILAYREDAALSVPLPEIEGGDKGDGWQPIDTAPKDGSEVLLFCVPNEIHSLKPHIAAGYWHKTSGLMAPGVWRFLHGVGPSFKPTHWLPLPAAPSASIEGETDV